MSKLSKKARAIALKRPALAKRWEKRIRKLVRKLVKGQFATAAKAIGDGGDPPDELDRERLATELFDGLRPMTLAILFESWRVTATEFAEKAGKSFAGKATILAERPSGVSAAKADEWADFLSTHDFDGVEAHLRAISERGARTTAGTIQKIFDRAGAEMLSRGEIAKLIRSAGAVESDKRAALWARTESAWSYNEGAHVAYVDNGIELEQWVTTPDDALCDYCSAMDGVIVRTNEPFIPAGDALSVEGVEREYRPADSIEHPPLHPNCRCVMVGL